MEYGWNIIPNLGIKVNRWPEQHVPQKYQAELQYISEHGGVVNADSALGRAAIASEISFYEALQVTYTPEQLKHLRFQVNNEAFHPYGLKPVKMGHDYQKLSMKTVLKYFPDAKLDINTAGFLNVDEIIEFYSGMIEEDPKITSHLAIGVNDYSASLDKFKLAYIGDVDFVNWPGIGKVNIRFIDKLWHNDFARLRIFCEKYGIELKIEEAGLGAWGDDILPDPVWSVKYELVSAAGILDPKKESVIMVWDLPKVQKNGEIIKILRAINSQ
jgi:hypothetical protein